MILTRVVAAMLMIVGSLLIVVLNLGIGALAVAAIFFLAGAILAVSFADFINKEMYSDTE